LESIGRFPNIDKLSSFIGLVPSTNSSGETEKIGKTTPRKHNALRAAIIESAWVAARTDSHFIEKLPWLLQTNGTQQSNYKNCQKTTNRIHYVLKNQKTYEYSLA